MGKEMEKTLSLKELKQVRKLRNKRMDIKKVDQKNLLKSN